MQRILLVDDEANTLERLSGVFEETFAGRAYVLKAMTGEAACRILRRSPIDLLITDIMMPGMSGIELVAVAEQLNPNGRSILFTGHDESEYARQAVRFSTCVDFLLKTIDDDTLLKVVSRQLEELERAEPERRRTAGILSSVQNEAMLRYLFFEGERPDAQLMNVNIDAPVYAILCRCVGGGAGGETETKVNIRLRDFLSVFPEYDQVRLEPGEWLAILGGADDLSPFAPLEEYVRARLCAIQDYMHIEGVDVSFIALRQLTDFDRLPALVQQLRGELERLSGRQEEVLALYPPEPRRASPNRKNILEYAQRYIDENLNDSNLCVDVIAERTHYNPAHLSRLFKQETGVSLTDYIVDRRIDMAKTLLRDGNQRVADISKAIGILSPSYFSYFFRKHCGMSPKEYQHSLYSGSEQ